MALNNQGPIPESREQEPIFDTQSTVSLVFTPRALPYEARELSVGEHLQTTQEYDSSVSICRSLALHDPALHEFWTADNQIRAEVKKLISSRWFRAGDVLCWPDDPIPQLSVSSPDAGWSKSGYILFNEHLYVQATLCFDKAGQLLERDIAAAYQSRKEAWLLFGKSADQHAWHASFAKVANSFLDCAIRTAGKQQVVCYLRAAECFLQTKDWKLAADAFAAAEEFSLAARNFCRAGCFKDAMDLIENYADRIQKDFANEITEMARLQTPRQSQPGKTDRIISLANANALMSRPSEALLCFARCASDLVSLQNATMSTFLSNSTLFLSYCNGLAALARTFQASSIDTQRLLGFEPAQTQINVAPVEEIHAASNFRVFSSSIMFKNAEAATRSMETTPYVLGLTAMIITESDLVRLAKKAVLDKLRSEIQAMHNSANLARYTLPCLDFAIFGSCKLSYCGRHELGSRELSDDIRQIHFNERLRGHVLQALIVHSYGTEDSSSEFRSYQWASIYKLYETLAPHFPPLGNVLCVEPVKIRELSRGSDVISTWCERNLHELRPRCPLPRWFMSNVLVSLELAYRVQRQSFTAYAPKLHSLGLVNPHPDLLVHIPGLPGPDRSIIHHFIDFYIGQSDDALKRVIFAAHHVVFKELMIEANVLIHLFESIGREMVVQGRRWKSGIPGIYNGLLFPQSWALDIVQHPPQAYQQGWTIEVFLESLYKTLEYMRVYQPGTDGRPSNSILYGFHQPPLSLLLRGIFILRINLAVNLGFNSVAKNAIRVAIIRSLTGPGVIHNSLCACLTQADTWSDLESALSRSPLNRSADRLVHIVYGTTNAPPPHSLIKRISYLTIQPDLKNLLSLADEPGPRREVTLSSEIKPFVPGQDGTRADDSNL
ncbi:hypothetical protein FRC09_020922 [Ceratobasidium sp. 395]|nr:hypothetical protein FRC09_020922 [Ceratobasidium sp. 395]